MEKWRCSSALCERACDVWWIRKEWSRDGWCVSYCVFFELLMSHRCITGRQEPAQTCPGYFSKGCCAVSYEELWTESIQWRPGDSWSVGGRGTRGGEEGGGSRGGKGSSISSITYLSVCSSLMLRIKRFLFPTTQDRTEAAGMNDQAKGTICQ